MAVKDVIEKVLAAVGDLVSLEVYTFSGTASVAVVNGKLEFDNLLQKSSSVNADIKLVAATKVNLDLDRCEFRTSEVIDGRSELFELHEASVKTALEARKAVMEAILALAPKVGK